MSICLLIVEDWLQYQASRNSRARLEFACPKILLLEMSNECPCSSAWFAGIDLGSCLLMVICQTCFDLFRSFTDVALCTVVAVEHVDGVAFVRCCNLVLVTCLVKYVAILLHTAYILLLRFKLKGLTNQERQVLINLKKDKNIVILPADKR